MKKGLSLHIGVGRTDPNKHRDTAYEQLRGCELDARAMRTIALHNHFHPIRTLINERATFHSVEGCVRYAIKNLERGDTFLWTFSGHGVQLSSVVDRGYNEGMVLYDYILIDDWINVLLRRFSHGVRIILVADCCNSDTIYEFAASQRRSIDDSAAENPNIYAAHGYRNKLLDRRIADEHRKLYTDFYDATTKRFNGEAARIRREIAADLVAIAACGEKELALDTPRGGVLTRSIVDALAGVNVPGGKPFRGTYKEFEQIIHYVSHTDQRPRIQPIGPHSLNDSYPFFQGPPFSL